ncbi:MAG TPA: hypothetical protein VG734_00505 [Lacunisphaera sp.]|nr:hypothetical protein [Lacunisphaera sp.]
MKNSENGNVVNSSARKMAQAASLAGLGLALAGAGIYIGETDDAPGAALLGILLMIVLIAFAVRVARRQAS